MRSSRQLERRCQQDMAFRVLAGNQAPDQVTIARFRIRHQHALAGFLVASLKPCAAAGMVRVGTVALDGTRLAGNARAGQRMLALLKQDQLDYLIIHKLDRWVRNLTDVVLLGVEICKAGVELVSATEQIDAL